MLNIPFDPPDRSPHHARVIRRGVRVELEEHPPRIAGFSSAWRAFGKLVGRDYDMPLQPIDGYPRYHDDLVDQRFDFHMVDGLIYIPAFRYAPPSDNRYTLPKGIHISFRVSRTAIVFHGWIEVQEQQRAFPQNDYLTDAGIEAASLRPMPILIRAMLG